MTHKAIVLAAGLGTRLRPLTAAVPKPLLPVWGEPMLARIVSLLRGWGVDDIVVNCHYLHEQVEAWVADLGAREGAALKIRASYEPEILGTGGVLNPLREWIGSDDFFLVNGDIVVDGVSAKDFAAPMGPDVLGRCLVTEEGPRTIEVEPTCGYVTNWKSDDPGWEGTYTYCGFALFRAQLLDFVEPTGFSSVITACDKAMMAGHFMQVIRPKALGWADAGTVASYIDLNRDGTDNGFADLPQVRAALDGTDAKVEFLGARGSDRAFFRAGDRVIILYDDAKRGENARYAGHARWLAERGVPVPQVLVDRPDLKTLALSWAGEERKMSLEEGVKVVEALAAFNALDATALELEPRFDAELYRWERGLFAEHCLGTRFHLEMPPAVEVELATVAERLLAEPVALVHRDFQSTNVLWKGTDLSFIDFQGMRLGAAAYDLASYLYDPYVTFSEGERRALAALYAKKAGRPEIVDILPLAAVQRLVQCLGAYGRLASVGQPQFGRHVVPALKNLKTAAEKAKLPAIAGLAEELLHREGHCSCGHHHEHGHADGQ